MNIKKININFILLFLSFIIVLYIPFSTYLNKNKQSKKYSEVISEYDMSSIPSYFRHKEVYQIGKNSVGLPIFKNSKKAFEQAMIDFDEACTILENELGIGPVMIEWRIYANQYAWEPDCDESLKKEVSLLFQFLYIYRNSYDYFYH